MPFFSRRKKFPKTAKNLKIGPGGGVWSIFEFFKFGPFCTKLKSGWISKSPLAKSFVFDLQIEKFNTAFNLHSRQGC